MLSVGLKSFSKFVLIVNRVEQVGVQGNPTVKAGLSYNYILFFPL